MNATLERRLRQLRSRLLVRAWDYRQRRHARGAWFRLRRVLVDADEAYAVSPDVTRELVAEGYHPEAAGTEFHPQKLIVFISRERLARIPGARPVPLRLDGELLLADHLVLVPFAAPPDGRAGPRPRGTGRRVRGG